MQAFFILMWQYKVWAELHFGPLKFSGSCQIALSGFSFLRFATQYFETFNTVHPINCCSAVPKQTKETQVIFGGHWRDEMAWDQILVMAVWIFWL